MYLLRSADKTLFSTEESENTDLVGAAPISHTEPVDQGNSTKPISQENSTPAIMSKAYESHMPPQFITSSLKSRAHSLGVTYCIKEFELPARRLETW